MLKGWLSDQKEGLPAIEACSVRLRLTGLTDKLEDLHKIREDFAGKEIVQNNIVFFIEKAEIACKPAYDLKALAEYGDPPGLLARKLLTLESREPAENYKQIIGENLEELNSVYTRYAFFWNSEENNVVTETETRRILLERGYQILNRLLEQKI